MIDLGDRMTIYTTVFDTDGTAVEAAGASPAITLEVRSPAPTDPDNPWTDITSSIVLDPDTLQYSAPFTPDAAGVWAYRWRTFGTFVGTDYAEFVVADHAPDLNAAWSVEGYSLIQGVTVDDADVPRVDMAVRLAAAYVRRMSGQDLIRVVDDEVTFDGNGNTLMFLPQRPVIDVASVVVDGEAWVEGTDYDWSARRGTIRVIGGRWPCGDRNVVVTYTHGYDPMPLEVQGVVYGLARRAVDNPVGTAIRSETLGSYSVAYEAFVGGLTAHESAVIDDLRLPNGVAA